MTTSKALAIFAAVGWVFGAMGAPVPATPPEPPPEPGRRLSMKRSSMFLRPTAILVLALCLFGAATHVQAFPLGDVDLDGDIDVDDINTLHLHLNFGGPYIISGDIDADGDIDRVDVNILVQDLMPTSAPGIGTQYGDANLDGAVNLVDLNIWLAPCDIILPDIFPPPPPHPAWECGDFSGDGLINLEDLNLWLASPAVPAGGDAPAIVPEPASLGLLAWGALMLLWRQSRQHKRGCK